MKNVIAEKKKTCWESRDVALQLGYRFKVLLSWFYLMFWHYHRNFQLGFARLILVEEKNILALLH